MSTPAEPTLTFTTPARPRDPQPVPVTWCGEEITVRRPKDAALYFASTISGEVIEPDRAAALFEFLSATLDAADYRRFLERIQDRDDPVDVVDTAQLVRGLLDRWHDYPGDGTVDPLTVEPGETRPAPGPARIVHEDLDLDVVAYPPKDIVLLLVAASIASTATLGQQAWAIGLFLDSALDAPDSVEVSHRLRDRDDDLDLHHIAEIVAELIDRWSPKPNRAQRRAAHRGQQ